VVARPLSGPLLRGGVRRAERRADVAVADVTHFANIAIVEAKILHRAAQSGALKDSVAQVENEYGAPAGSLGCGVLMQTRIACLLYCLILVPKEVWSLDKNSPVYKKIKWSPDSCVTVTKDDYGSYADDPVYYFVRHLRNAVAHVRFSFDDDTFTFGDKRGALEFEAKMKTVELYKFLEDVGILFASRPSAV